MRSLPLLWLVACGGPAPSGLDDPTDDPGGETDPAGVDTLVMESDVPDGADSDTDPAVVDSDPVDTDVVDACGGCDDGDPCTEDACVAGECVFEPWSGDPRTLFDLALLRDPTTLDVDVLSTTTEVRDLAVLKVQAIRYTSYQSDGCVLTPVRLEAYVATPIGVVGSRASTPGLVVAHGLGGYADADAAKGPAADHGVVALAYSGPGQGQSEGTGSTPDHLFDVLDHPRDSWFWEHAAAAIRGLTVLETLREVDPDRLAMSGYSGGAIATHLVNGVDDRVKVAIPVSGAGHLDLAIGNPTPGWELDLLKGMTPPRDAASPEWARYVETLDAKHFTPHAHGRTLFVNGAQDEFFPLTTTAATYADLLSANADNRLLTIHDWDHGWFALFAGERPGAWSSAAFRNYVRWGLGLPGGALPPRPELVAVVDGVCAGPSLCVQVLVSLPATGLTITEGRARFTLDGLAFAEVELKKTSVGWVGELPWLSTAQIGLDHAAWYAEFELRDGLLGVPFRVTSAPRLPTGWQPQILPIAGPIP